MPDKPVATLFYVHDPMCSWCWGFRPVWLQIRQQLPQTVQLIGRVGGLAADSDETMPDALQQDIQSAWKRIQQVIPGTHFNYDFWTQNAPRRSTYPACRAVIAARELADKADDMTLGIQQAYYLQAKNPSDQNTLLEVAVEIGIDSHEFTDMMQSEELQAAFETELEQVRAINVYSFPSLVLQVDSQHYPIRLDYNSAQNMLADITSVLSEHSH